jgi:O-antigen/teichoic acid export membrane protein
VVVLAQPLVRAWVGPKMLGAAPVMQILAITVAIRVGNATATTLLKGAGRVRYLALANISAGVVNVILSVLLVKPLGLIGVALGTLIPIALVSWFVIFPAACERVAVAPGWAFRRAMWPALWPALVAAICLELTRRISSGTLLAVMAQAALADLLYLVLFLVAIGRHDREQYGGKLMDVIARRGRLVPAA